MCKIAPYGRTAIVHNFKLKLADKIILNFIKNKKIIIIFSVVKGVIYRQLIIKITNPLI